MPIDEQRNGSGQSKFVLSHSSNSDSSVMPREGHPEPALNKVVMLCRVGMVQSQAFLCSRQRKLKLTAKQWLMC